MDSSQISERVYQQPQSSDGFLNAGRQHEIFPHKTQQDQGAQQQQSSPKQKRIKKQQITTSKKPKSVKRRKDITAMTQKGRPPNKNIEREHLRINRSFNDIVYHFSRLMIFLKLKQGIQTSTHAMELQNQQSAWMSQTENIMSLENFPSYQQQKPAFLLHPNSLHFVFQYRDQKQSKTTYYQQEVKYMLFAFLKKRKMLTSTIYHYINNYWPDIVFLVNNPDGASQGLQFPIQHQNSGQVEDMVPSEEISQSKKSSPSESNQQKNKKKDSKSKKKGKKQALQMQILKSQLLEDDSIAAYQIACYLHACCLKFKLKITKDF